MSCIFIKEITRKTVFRVLYNLYENQKYKHWDRGSKPPLSPGCPLMLYCDESVSRGRETGTKGRETGTKGRRTGTIGTKERGNEKPYGLVQIEYLDRGTSPRHVWTWRGRVTPFLDV